ncbi:MAG: PPC domain-containing protein [bacterium]|nr:PPC domain-containing protein [bacterium]
MRNLLFLPRFPRVGLACLAAVVLFSACGAEEEPTTEPSPTTTSPSTTSSTLAPTTTTVAPTTTTVAPTTTTVAPTEASEEVAGPDIGAETTWQDLFNTLTASEQSCIRDAVGEELEWVLQQVVLTEDETRLWDAPIYPCLPTPIVEAVFLAGVVYGMELEGLEVGEEQEACLQEVIAEMDGATLLLAIASQVEGPDESAQMENAAQLLELMAGFLRCLPGLAMGEGEGAFPGGDVYSSGWSCPLGTTSDGVEGALRVRLGESVGGVLESVGESGVFVFGAMEGELYEVEVELGSLSDSILAVCDAEGFELAWNDDRPDGGLESRLFWKASFSGDVYVGVSGYGEGSYTLTVTASDIVDDYSDLVVGAAALELGESVEGVLEYSDDVDFFAFGAVEGELYEVEVDLGTLLDSVVEVYDADGYLRDSNDDRPDGGLASRLFWRAPETGEFYVGVSGYGEGSYAVTVTVSDIVDDYADGVEGAARVVLEETVEGVLDYAGDVDYFVFGAVEGELYGD